MEGDNLLYYTPATGGPTERYCRACRNENARKAWKNRRAERQPFQTASDIPQHIIDKLNTFYEITPSGCKVWTSTTDHKGYGVITYLDSRYYVHRLSAMIHNDLKSDEFALHHCDNPPCFNPEHLYAGKYSENSKDMRNRGRGLIGGKNHKARLTEDEVRYIRDLAANGVPQKDIIAMFDVQQAAISKIILRKTWRHI